MSMHFLITGTFGLNLQIFKSGIVLGHIQGVSEHTKTLSLKCPSMYKKNVTNSGMCDATLLPADSGLPSSTVDASEPSLSSLYEQ